MTFAVTPIYALPLALIYLVLWFRVTTVRSAAKISFGDGGNMMGTSEKPPTFGVIW